MQALGAQLAYQFLARHFVDRARYMRTTGTELTQRIETDGPNHEQICRDIPSPTAGKIGEPMGTKCQGAVQER